MNAERATHTVDYENSIAQSDEFDIGYGASEVTGINMFAALDGAIDEETVQAARETVPDEVIERAEKYTERSETHRPMVINENDSILNRSNLPYIDETDREELSRLSSKTVISKEDAEAVLRVDYWLRSIAYGDDSEFNVAEVSQAEMDSMAVAVPVVAVAVAATITLTAIDAVTVARAAAIAATEAEVA